MSIKPVIFQGTFDPFTNGHLAIVKSMLELFGAVRILLLINPDKTPIFSVQERKEIIQAATAGLTGVSVDSFDGLLVDYMRPRGLTICARGIRNVTDAAYEIHNAHLSQALYPCLCTLFFPCPAEWSQVSSSAVKGACQSGTFPTKWLPVETQPIVAAKFNLQKTL